MVLLDSGFRFWNNVSVIFIWKNIRGIRYIYPANLGDLVFLTVKIHIFSFSEKINKTLDFDKFQTYKQNFAQQYQQVKSIIENDFENFNKGLR